MRSRPTLLLQRRGFSVTELLVVIVVSGILITSLFGMLREDTEIQTCLDDQSSDLRRSRIAADLLFNDLVQAGARVVRIPVDASATANARDYQPSYEMLGPDFIVFNADLDSNFAARTTAITYEFLSAGTKTLPGKSLQMSRADSQSDGAGINGYAGAETIAYFLQTNGWPGAPEPYGANDCTFTLYRKVNDEEPEIVQRGVRSYDYSGVLNGGPVDCNGELAPTPTDRLPIASLFTYQGFFYACGTPPCILPQVYGDSDLDGVLDAGEIGGLAGTLNFNSGDRFNDKGAVENSECDWILILAAKGTVPAVYGCDSSKDINGTGRIEMSLDEVVKTVNLQLTVESPQACDSYQQNAGFVRNQINLTIKPPNPPLRGVGCAPYPDNVKTLAVSPETTTCDGQCGRSVILEFPPSLDDPFFTGTDPDGDGADTDNPEYDIVVYNVYQDVNDSGQFTQVAAMPPSDTGGSDYEFVLTGLDPSNKYTFKVKPMDCSGFESPEAPAPKKPDAAFDYKDPPTAGLLPSPSNEPACAVVSANGLICAPDTVLLTWGYADPTPGLLGKDFIIEIQDSSGNWNAVAPNPANSDVTFNPQNSVAGTEFRSGNCNMESAAGPGYEDCYYAFVPIDDRANSFQYRILPPGHAGCYCGNCNPITTCDWCSPFPPVCQVVDDVCSPDGTATLMVTWNSFELEFCSGLAAVPTLKNYRLMRDYNPGANSITATRVIQEPVLLTNPDYLVRELTEEAKSETCALPPVSPVGANCALPPPGRYDLKGDPVEGANAAYPRPTGSSPNVMTGCPTGSGGDPSDTEIQGAPVDVCALGTPVNTGRGDHRYLGIDYTAINMCEPVVYALATRIVLPLADDNGETEKFFVTECQGFAVPNQDGYDFATAILAPDPVSDEAPFLGKFDSRGPSHLTYTQDTSVDPRWADKMCYEVPSTDPQSPLIDDPLQNQLKFGFKTAAPGVADPTLSDLELVRYATSLYYMPFLPLGNPDPALPDSRVVDFSYNRRTELDGSGWHNKSDPYSWSVLNGLPRPHKQFTALGSGAWEEHVDPEDSQPDAPLDFLTAYNYQVYSVAPAFGCGGVQAAPRSCSYGYTSYIPARPEPIFQESRKFEAGLVDNGIKFTNDQSGMFIVGEWPAINLSVDGNDPSKNYIEIYGMSRTDCEYPTFNVTKAAEACLVPDPACQDITYRWFRRECDASLSDVRDNCNGSLDPADPSSPAIKDALDRLTINANVMPVEGPYDAGLIWEEVIRGLDAAGNNYLQSSDGFDVDGATGHYLLDVGDCDGEGEKFFYYTMVAERLVTFPDGSQRTLYSDPSPLIKFDCEEQDTCKTTCEPNAGDPFDNNWGMVCMNEVGDPSSERIFRMEASTYEMVVDLPTMRVTSYKHYNPDLVLPNPAGAPATLNVTKGHYEYVDQQSGIPLILAYNASQKDEEDLPLIGSLADGGPFIGGDQENWRVISHVKRGPFEQELVAYYGGDSTRKVIWRFHPESVMLHIEWGGSSAEFFTLVNTSPNRGSAGVYSPGTAKSRPRNMILSAPDEHKDMDPATQCPDFGPDGLFHFQMDNWAGLPVGSRCDEITGWEDVRLGWRQFAVWSTAGLTEGAGVIYDPAQASASLLSVEWQEMPSPANQVLNSCNPDLFDNNPATRWLYGAPEKYDADGDCSADAMILKGETGQISRRESFSRRSSSDDDAPLEAGCEVKSSVTSFRIPKLGATVSDPNFIDLFLRPMYKTQVTRTDGTQDLVIPDLYRKDAAQYGASGVAVSSFANRRAVMVSHPGMSDGNRIKYPNYLFRQDQTSPVDVWSLGLDNGSVSRTSAEPYTAGGTLLPSQYFAEGASLCYLPEWGGYVFQLRDPSESTGVNYFRVEYDKDRWWDDDEAADVNGYFQPVSARWSEENLTNVGTDVAGLFSGLPLPQPRFYLLRWNNAATNTAEFTVWRDSDKVEGTCSGDSMTMFRNGDTDLSVGAMGALMFTFDNRDKAAPVGWPLNPDDLTTMSVTPEVLIHVKSGSRPDTGN